MRAMVVAGLFVLSITADAALLRYTFTGHVQDNTMSSGDFAAASDGSTAWLQITIDADTPANSISLTRRSWMGMPGVITSITAHANSTTHSFSSASPDEASIWNDDLDYETIPGNVIAVDSFRLRAATASNTAHMGGFIIDLSAVSLGNTLAPSSLASTNWPTTSAELNPASFNNARFMGLFQDTTYSNGVFAELSSVMVEVIPSPSTLSLVVCAGGVALRRRR